MDKDKSLSAGGCYVPAPAMIVNSAAFVSRDSSTHQVIFSPQHAPGRITHG